MAPVDNADVLDELSLELLKTEHPERIKWKTALQNYRALYRGGEEFLAAAGTMADPRALSPQAANLTGGFGYTPRVGSSRKRRFLYQLEGEPDVKYNQRWERAYYIGYFAAIIDYFRHWLFSQPPIMRAVDQEETPEWFAPFIENATGAGCGFLDFFKDIFLNVLIDRYAGILIGSPTQEGALPVLTHCCAEEILDWDKSSNGELKWVVLKKIEQIRDFPKEREQIEVYTYVDRSRWRSWQVSGDKLEVVGDGAHMLGRVPFVFLEIPHGLWPANKLATWQIDLFNKMNMLSYAQLNSCFLQPYIKTNDRTGAAGRIFGDGILITLQAGDKDVPGEEFGWAAAPMDPLTFSAGAIKEQRDEGYRIIHQMSLAVDSQAVGAIARSGVSKIEDRRASEIILAGYGGIVRDAMAQVLNTVSEITGSGEAWHLQGYDNFQVSSLEEELQTAALVSTMNIPSPTFDKVILTDIATGRITSHIDEATREKIRAEINERIDEREEAKMIAPQVPASTALGQEEETEDKTGVMPEQKAE